jgi:hypothetical protein
MKNRILLFVSVIFLILVGAEAICGEILIDNFEDGDISDWRMMYDEPDVDKNITLSTFTNNGSYSIRLWNGPISYAVDFAKENINITFPTNRAYRYYNLSFWYFAEDGCSYPGDHDFYLSNENSFENWISIVLNTATGMGCGYWDFVSMSIPDEFWWKDPDFSLDGVFFGSINIETMWENMIYYDEIKLIPTIPETNWTCSGWSDCYPNNTQYRTCVDLCETGQEESLESQSCTCSPNWQCDPWNICTEGVQTRTCTDLNGCGTLTGQPPLQQACPLNPTSATVDVSPTEINRGGEVSISATVSDDDGINKVIFHIIDSDNIIRSGAAAGSGDNYVFTYEIPDSVQIGEYQVLAYIEDDKGESSWFVGNNFTVVDRFEIWLTSDKTIYNQSGTIQLSGTTKDASGTGVACDCELNFSSGLWKDTIALESDDIFLLNRTVSLTDPAGNWNISVVCWNVIGRGSDTLQIRIDEPPRYDYYNVVINSPVVGSIYYQGEEFMVTATVKSDDMVVSGAMTFAVLPTGDRISMVETAAGVYSEIVRLDFSDPVGSWEVTVRAIKGNYTGENSFNITVRRPDLCLALIEPPASSHILGNTVTVKVNVTYPDGSPTTNLLIYLETPSGNVTLDDMGDGVYEVSYTPKSLGTFDLIFSGDVSLDYQTRSIEIREPIFLDYILMYWYLVLMFIVLILILSYSSVKKILSSSRTESLKLERKEVQALQKELQNSYFKRNEIDRQTFDRRAQELDERLRKLDEKIKLTKRKR